MVFSLLTAVLSSVTCDTHGDEKPLTSAIDELDEGTVRVLRNNHTDEE